ncbi:hypothetical protein [Mycobacterium sp. KBS0706]|uniref:hypothetical protein n=1 Tax=Mycobacterium sp. KBS0706 TaxID=2578109 RepID=UPI001C8F50ED|nr:hypothetical protein [Mycobacterium sp. KBS0706]
MHDLSRAEGGNAKRSSSVWVVAIVAGLLGAAGPVLAQDAISEPAQKTIGAPTKKETVPSLIVMNARGASLVGTTLTLTGVSPNAIVFADRPVRAAGHALTAHLMREWTAGSGTFAKDPPNATVSVLSSDASSVSDAVVVLKDPKLDGDTLAFNVEVLEGDLSGADGPASVFIDIIGLPFTPLSFAGVARRSAYRAAWYRGAAAPYYHPYHAPYYHPACGHYPYPPCY